jgi:DNA segregation ATPase FtsK/SpoIIIE, S-DNA-T family
MQGISCIHSDHHRGEDGSGSVVLAIVALGAAAVALRIAIGFVLAHLWWFVAPPAVLVLVVLAVAVVRFARLDAAGRRYWLSARRHRFGWKRLARNLNLGRPDKHRSSKVNHMKARFTPASFGWTVTAKTVPGVGREQIEAASAHLADAWKCQRVAVTQDRPGRVRIRAMRRDVLLEGFGLEVAPQACPYRVWLGKDEHGADRFMDLRNVSGVCVGGQPGGGKSQVITSWETQLAPSPAVQFANVDGKGAGEFDDFTPRAWVTCGDSMDRFLATLESLSGLMYDRLRVVRDFTGGKKNIWTVGVSSEWPLQFSVFDETQAFFDMAIAKALGKEREKQCAQAINLGSDLVRKGRSVGMCSVFATQKPTTDSLPSAISSNCALSIAFSLRTLEAAKAALGADIGNYPSLSPVALSLPDYAGVCVATIPDGMNPFTRLRSPLVPEDQAAKVAADSAHLRKDPRAVLPVGVPDDVSELTRDEPAR